MAYFSPHERDTERHSKLESLWLPKFSDDKHVEDRTSNLQKLSRQAGVRSRHRSWERIPQVLVTHLPTAGEVSLQQDICMQQEAQDSTPNPWDWRLGDNQHPVIVLIVPCP